MYHDRRGLPVTGGNAEVLDRFEDALLQLHGYYGNPLATIDEALAADPSFLMGLCLRAGLFVASSERRAVPELRDTVERAERVIERGQSTPRERGHIAAARAWLEGDFARATDLYNRVSADYPRDALALQIAHLCNFYLGRATWLRDHVAAALPHLSRSEPIHGYALGMLAFGLEECNEFARAEEAARHALSHTPRDPWAIHALAHCLEMQGLPEQGVKLLEGRESDWAPDNSLAVHNYWHLALFHFDLDNRDRVLEIYDRHIRGARSEVNLELVDASSMLWRLWLSGYDVRERFAELADTWARVEEEGYYAFNDVHALMAYAGAGRDEDVRRVIAGLERCAASGEGTNASLAFGVGLPIANALRAFARADYRSAIDGLYAVRSAAHRFGGSNAQRDFIDFTLVEAALRGAEAGLARGLVQARLAQKPRSPLARRSHGRVFDAFGAYFPVAEESVGVDRGPRLALAVS